MSKYLKGSLLVSPLLFLSFLFVGLAFAQDGGPDVLPGKLSIPSVLGASTSTTWQNINSNVLVSSSPSNPALSLEQLYLGDVAAPNGWRATGLCSGNSGSGATACLAANGGSWYWGTQSDSNTINTTMDLTSSGNLTTSGNVTTPSLSLSNRTGGASWRAIGDTSADDWLRLNIDQAFGGIALYKPVAIGTGGLAVGSWDRLNTGDGKFTGNLTVGGNVGIGTTNPLSKLQVAGGDLYVSNGQIQLDNPNGGWGDSDLIKSYGAIALRPDIDNSGDPFIDFLSGGGGNPTMRINTTTGSVGIGTTSPSGIGKTLEVAAYSGDATVKINSIGGPLAVTGSTYLLLSPSGGGRAYVNSLGGYLALGAGGVDSNAITILGNGNVGIGTTSPTSKLQVAAGTSGTLTLSGDKINLDGIAPGSAFSTGSLNMTNNAFSLISQDGRDMVTMSVSNGATPISVSNANPQLTGTAGANLGDRDSNGYLAGVYGWVNQGGSKDFAGYFQGQVQINGDLSVNGNVYSNGSLLTSDARLKTNAAPLSNVLDKLTNIRGVNFNWNSLHESLFGKDQRPRELGLIAQEVESQFPELISPMKASDGNEYKTVDYARFSAVLLQAIKELDQKDKDEAGSIQNLSSKVDNQQKEIEALKAEIEGLKANNR